MAEGDAHAATTTIDDGRGDSADGALSEAIQRGLSIVDDLNEKNEVEGLRFHFEDDLCYELDASRTVPNPGSRKCQLVTCEETEKGRTFAGCAKCESRYCGRDHQVQDWKSGGHKHVCAQLAKLRKGEDVEKQDVVVRLFCKIRLHLCPFALAHSDKQGRGFIFIQSPSTLEELWLARPVGRNGSKLERSVLLCFLTVDEFSQVVLKDRNDFEMVVVQESLEKAISAYDISTEVVVLVRLRCGYITLFTARLVPEARVCRSLAVDYGWEKHDSLQLNLD